jgi:fatty acid desaturase
MRYRVDIISVLTVVTVFGLQLAAYWLKWPWYAMFPLLYLVRELHLVEHNHAHLPIFRVSAFNEIVGWMCFISNGVALECYEMHHVQNHHRYTQQEKDWSSTFNFEGARYPDKPVGRIYYSLTYAILAWCFCTIEFIRNPQAPIARRFLRSVIICFGVTVALAVLDPLRWFLFFGVPWLLVYFGIGINNYNHHRYCELTTPYNSANVDLRFAYRSFGFNIGYHVAHHMKPTLHWSLLPLYHDQIKDQIPEENYVRAGVYGVSSIAGHPEQQQQAKG